MISLVSPAGAGTLGRMKSQFSLGGVRGWSAVVAWTVAGTLLAAAPVTFVLTSDLHYGLSRGSFRGASNVGAPVVNAALAAKINGLPAAVLPNDGGLRAGQAVGPVAFVVVTGDLTNRQELYPLHIQSATASWRQLEESFIGRLTLVDAAGRPVPLLLVPGNHDVSNAIGAPSRLVPATDATSMAEIYNRMMHPAVPRTPESYRYATDKIQFSRDFGGAHCIFLTMWPDSVARAWIEQDLKGVAATTPVFLFCHDQPDIEAKHLTNPNGAHLISSHDRFENLVADVCADGMTVDAPTTIEQRALAAFLRAHANIAGYFHGNANWNEFYTWRGPDSDLALRVFRVDSPIKGRVSGKDETKLSFQVITYDVAANTLTARECLWNARAANESDATPVAWGAATTVSLLPH
jgi:hypothetical protein